MENEHPSLMNINELQAQQALKAELFALAEAKLSEITERKQGLLAEIVVLQEKKRILQEQTDAVQIKLDLILAKLDEKNSNLPLEREVLVKLNAELNR
jgi:hypothetical protein